ncbi:MAG: phosphatase PAP2 family protein [Candidatus Heimdallarchaeota archaeon]|nr:phosphatase PAP2 family protein [Candidatus Heimdallarchaeota archaeon]
MSFDYFKYGSITVTLNSMEDTLIEESSTQLREDSNSNNLDTDINREDVSLTFFQKIKNPYRRTKLWWSNLGIKKQKMYMRFFGIIIVIIYLLLAVFLMGFRLDHALVSCLILAVFFGDARKFILYWGPFILIWISYDMLRVITDSVAHRVYVKELFDMEVWLTGWFMGDDIIPFAFQKFKLIGLEAGNLEYASILNLLNQDGPIVFVDTQTNLVKFLNILGGVFYSNHFTGPLVIGLFLYWKVDDKTEFKRFTYTMFITSYIAFITFILFPTAAPWYVWDGGKGLNFTKPVPGESGSAAGLLDLDELFGKNIFQNLYGALSSNQYAAVPSVHSAYALIVAIFAIRKWRRVGYIVLLWPIGMWFSALWLNHHYLIDIVWAVAYVLPVYFVSLRIFKTKKDKKDYDEKEERGEKPFGKAKIFK